MTSLAEHRTAAMDGPPSGARVLGFLALALGITCLVATCIGALAIPPRALLGALLAPLGLGSSEGLDDRVVAVFWQVRLPRVVLGVAVGGALALSGAALQTLCRNVLADPSVLGVSTGATLGAALALLLTHRVALPKELAIVVVPALAFAGALLALVAVIRLARSAGGLAVDAVLVVGVGVTALSGALLGVVIYVANDAELRSITFWTLGSLGGATWPALLGAGVPLVAGVVLLLAARRSLDLLALGEAEARHLGVDVVRVKRQVLLGVGLAVGAAVSLAGIISFIGLLVPHVLRRWRGPGHAFLVPGAVLAGGTLVVAADTVARTVVAPAELPIGVITALVGAPALLAILVGRARRDA